MDFPIIPVFATLSAIALVVLIVLAFKNPVFYRRKIYPVAQRYTFFLFFISTSFIGAYTSGMNKHAAITSEVVKHYPLYFQPPDDVIPSDTLKGYTLMKQRQSKKALNDEIYNASQQETKAMNNAKINIAIIALIMMGMIKLIEVATSLYLRRKQRILRGNAP